MWTRATKITAWVLPLALIAGAPAQVGCGGGTTAFTTAVARAEKMTLLEGLPHQMFEHEQMEAERRTKPVQDLHGYSFYKEPLAPSDADTKRLRQLMADPATFQPFSGEKKCGGFHPDYAVEWYDGSTPYRALVCFGCNEVKLFGPGLDARHDLNERAESELEATLTKYRKNRPAPSY